MRTLLLSILTISLVACSASIPSSFEELTSRAVEFTPPKAMEWQLENGLNVVFLQDDELPVVEGTLYVPGGGLYDPQDLPGLASFVGSQMREGAVPGYSSDDFDLLLDSLGASIESGSGSEYYTVSFFSLKEDFPKIFKLFSQVVREPRFAPERLRLAKQLALDGISRRKDNPGLISELTYQKALFGRNSPRSAITTAETVRRIGRDALIKTHARFFRPAGSYLALTGSLSAEEAKLFIEERFGDWESASSPIPPLQAEVNPLSPGIYVVERDFDQTTINLGHIGPPRLTPNHFDFTIYNRMFGFDGMGNKLFTVLRAQLGLVYSIWGGFLPGTELGEYRINLATRSEEAVRAIEKVIELVEESTRVPPSIEEVEEAQVSAERSYVFRFNSSGKVVTRTALLKLLQYPEDFDATYFDNLLAVTPESVLAAAKRWIKPDEMVIVTTGRISASEVRQAVGERYRVFDVKFENGQPIIPVEAG